MLKDENLLAFADDIIISINTNKIEEIVQAKNHITSFGLSMNHLKCQYLSQQKYIELDIFARHQNRIKYFGTWIFYNKIDLIKKIKNCIKKYILKIRTHASLTTKITSNMEQALYNDFCIILSLPAILTN